MCGRRRGTRTPNTRIWNPVLYHWSYAPVKEVKLVTVSSLYELYALYSACSIFLLTFFLYESFYFLLCGSYDDYISHNLSEYFLSFCYLSIRILVIQENLNYARISATTPAPTVLPPSRIAN